MFFNSFIVFQIRELIDVNNCVHRLIINLRESRQMLTRIRKNFLNSQIAPIYNKDIQTLLKAYQKLGLRKLLKIYLLHSPL